MDKNFHAPTMILISSIPNNMLKGLEFANVGTVAENLTIAATALGIDSIVLGAAAVICQDKSLKVK